MKTFLIRDFTEPSGYRVYRAVNDSLPRTREESYVPWAVTHDNKVVYARVGEREHASWSSARNLRPYNSSMSQERRRLCQSELASFALNNRLLTDSAVNKVSSGIRNYLMNRSADSLARMKTLVYNNIGHYFYTNGGKGFGRISEQNKQTLGEDNVWNGIASTLANGRLDQVIAIHDAIGRKILEEDQDNDNRALKDRYARWGRILRQDWFGDDRRGREKRRGNIAATTVAGIVDANNPNTGIAPAAIDRHRGIDMFQRDPNRTPDDRADYYFDNADSKNLLFGAAISGTTGTLLQAGIAFDPSLVGESLKQYVFAIIGYLVGGGMHSLHEIMVVAHKAGVPYHDGALVYAPQPGTLGYSGPLPLSFVNSTDYRNWRNKYYDITVLGAIHWLYNTNPLPSHASRALQQVAGQ